MNEYCITFFVPGESEADDREVFHMHAHAPIDGVAVAAAVAAATEQGVELPDNVIVQLICAVQIDPVVLAAQRSVVSMKRVAAAVEAHGGTTQAPACPGNPAGLH